MVKTRDYQLNPIYDTADWLLNSGIQSQSINPQQKGGVAAWHEINKRIYPFLYSEITGYALSAYMFMNRIYPDANWLEAAGSAAEWLMSNAFHPLGGVRTRYYLVKNYHTPN